LGDQNTRAATRSDQNDPHPVDLTLADYGQSFDPIDPLGIPELHRRGYSGAGILVALFDTGFRKDHRSLAGRTIVAEHDFVCAMTTSNGRSGTLWLPTAGLPRNSHVVGLGGLDPGYGGIAFGASFASR
jgi:hypothetical protein